MSVLLRHRLDGVEVLTLNRPAQRNALDPALMRALSQALSEIERADQVRAVVLAASGGKAFCAGMDLKAFAGVDGALEMAGTETFQAFVAGRFPKPVVAAVQGAAVAGGFELVLACDLVVASTQARFGLPEVRHGLFPAGTGVLLPARIPLAIALELGLTGEAIDAARAAQLGLVNRLVAPAEVEAVAQALAQTVAANSPLGTAATLRLMRDCAEHGAAAARARIPAAMAAVFQSLDAKEGARAFAEKRPPQWLGK